LFSVCEYNYNYQTWSCGIRRDNSAVADYLRDLHGKERAHRNEKKRSRSGRQDRTDRVGQGFSKTGFGSRRRKLEFTVLRFY
jgi:hypothetical protein